MTGSSSKEDDCAVVAPLTFGAAMTEEKVEMTQEELYVDKKDKLSEQKATLKLLREVQCILSTRITKLVSLFHL